MSDTTRAQMRLDDLAGTLAACGVYSGEPALQSIEINGRATWWVNHEHTRATRDGAGILWQAQGDSPDQAVERFFARVKQHYRKARAEARKAADAADLVLAELADL